MSEYQYYEFQAIDRPLTQEQMAELRGYSTRAQITATSFACTTGAASRAITEKRLKEEAERRAREEARRDRERVEQRRKYLDSLVGREADLWQGVEQFIATKQP